jgi:hypothetical protein
MHHFHEVETREKSGRHTKIPTHIIVIQLRVSTEKSWSLGDVEGLLRCTTELVFSHHATVY